MSLRGMVALRGTWVDQQVLLGLPRHAATPPPCAVAGSCPTITDNEKLNLSWIPSESTLSANNSSENTGKPISDSALFMGMTHSGTPDLDRLDFAFTSASYPMRVAAVRRALVDMPLAAGPHVLAGRSRKTQHRVMRSWSAVVRSALDLRVTWSGFEAIDADRQYLVLALHESFVDVPVLAALPLDLRFTPREELFATKDVGAVLRASHHIPVPEKRSPSSTRLLVARMRAAVAADDSIVVFPQGSLLGVEIAFQPGALRLAQMLGLPVLPVAISGTHRAWGHPFDNEVHLGRDVCVTVLPPIEPASWNADRARATERSLKESAIETGLARRFDPYRDGWWDDYAFEIDPEFDGLKIQIDTHRALDLRESASSVQRTD